MKYTQSKVFPEEFRNIQGNYCTTIHCKNFSNTNPELYRSVSDEDGLSVFYCPECGSYPPILSNKAIVYALDQIKLNHQVKLVSCINSDCENHSRSVHLRPSHYYKLSKTATNKRRYKCKKCSESFTDQTTSYNSECELESSIFYSLLNKLAIREICSNLGLSPKSFYRHQDKIYNRCMYFAYLQDSKFRHSESFLSKRPQIFTSYAFLPSADGVNTGAVLFSSIDSNSGYVFDFNCNIVDTLISDEMDYVHNPFSDTAFFFNTNSKGIIDSANPAKRVDKNIAEVINRKYKEIMSRTNFIDPTADGKLYQSVYMGELMRVQYTAYAHIKSVIGKLSIENGCDHFIAHDALMRNAAINASLINHDKDRIIYYSEIENKTSGFMSEQISSGKFGWWKDTWNFLHQNGRDKGACLVSGTSISSYEWSVILGTMSDGGSKRYLNAIVKFASNLTDKSIEKSRMKPNKLYKWLNIYTVYYNYCLVQKDKKTPAQKFGVTDRAYTLSDIISGKIDNT